MFPIIALGALLGVVAYEELKPSSPDSGKAAGKMKSTDQAAVAPQSYIVTPITQGGRQVNPVEAVRNWTF